VFINRDIKYNILTDYSIIDDDDNDKIDCDIFLSWQGIIHRIYYCCGNVEIFCQKYFQIIFLDNRAVV